MSLVVYHWACVVLVWAFPAVILWQILCEVFLGPNILHLLMLLVGLFLSLGIALGLTRDAMNDIADLRREGGP